MIPDRLTHISENIFKLREHERLIGFYLYDECDQALARIEALLAEPGTYLSRYLVITLGGMLSIQGKKLIVPVEICKPLDLGKVKLFWRKESLMDAPTPHDVQRVTEAEEELILGYFDLEPYWAAKPTQPEEKPKNKTPGKPEK